MPSDTEQASAPVSIVESYNQGDPVQATAPPSTGATLSNAETLELFSQLLDVKFDEKFSAFKRDLDEKEAATQSKLKKLKTESKASSSFNFKGNKVQFKFNSSLLDAVDGPIKTILKGNLSAANSELERVKTLIIKRKFVSRTIAPLVGQPWKSTCQTNLLKIQRMRISSVQPKDERWPKSGRKSGKMCLAGLALPLPALRLVKFLLLVCPLAVLPISLFFVCSPFVDVTLNQQTSVSAAAREATGQIHLPAQAVLEEPLQPLQAANIQTDDKYQAALKRLGQDEYNLVNLVKCLGDFDPVELVGNFVEPSDSINDCISPTIRMEHLMFKGKGNLAFWDHIGL